MTKTIDALVEALEKMLPYAEEHDDCGPEGEGWQSDELVAEIKAARAALAQARAEQAEPSRFGSPELQAAILANLAPPAAPVAKLEPLSDAEIRQCFDYAMMGDIEEHNQVTVTRIIEAELNAKLGNK